MQDPQDEPDNDESIDIPGMGHDPLEWLMEDDEAPLETPVSETAKSADDELPTVDSAPPEETTTETDEEVTAPVSEASSDTPPEDREVLVSAEAATEVPNATAREGSSGSDNRHSDAQSFVYENHKAILTLPEKLSVQIIEPMHSEWKTLLYDLPQSLEVDASQLKDIDAAGMQLFYALVQQIAFKGADVVILNVTPALQQRFDNFGLHTFFAQYVHAA